jgi:hypothetical protein
VAGAWLPGLGAALVLVITAAPLVRFAARPTPETARRLEPATAVYLLATYVILLAWVLVEGGLTWD